jgi:hypothetical protein
LLAISMNADGAEVHVSKLLFYGLRKIKRAKILGIITTRRVSEGSGPRDENSSLKFHVEISRRNQNRKLFPLESSGDRRLKWCACVRRGSLVTPYRKASNFQSVNSECSGKHTFPITISFEFRPKPAGGAWQTKRARSTVSSRPVPLSKTTAANRLVYFAAGTS